MPVEKQRRERTRHVRSHASQQWKTWTRQPCGTNRVEETKCLLEVIVRASWEWQCCWRAPCSKNGVLCAGVAIRHFRRWQVRKLQHQAARLRFEHDSGFVRGTSFTLCGSCTGGRKRSIEWPRCTRKLVVSCGCCPPPRIHGEPLVECALSLLARLPAAQCSTHVVRMLTDIPVVQHGRFSLLVLSAQRREDDDLTDALLIGEEHDQAINANSQPAGGRHADLQRLEKIFIQHLRFIITTRALSGLVFKPGTLVKWVIQFSEGVAQFQAGRKRLEAFDGIRRSGLQFRQRGDKSSG